MKTFWLGVAICLAACSSGTSKAPTRVADPVPMAEREPIKAPSMLVAYERVRAMLAADSIDGLAGAAKEIESAAAGHAEVVASAAVLATAKNIDQARNAFGSVSKELIAVLVKDRDLAKGQHLFECPMVKGYYNKWIQPTEDLANPYMGKAMLACGGETDWK